MSLWIWLLRWDAYGVLRLPLHGVAVPTLRILNPAVHVKLRGSLGTVRGHVSATVVGGMQFVFADVFW